MMIIMTTDSRKGTTLESAAVQMFSATQKHKIGPIENDPSAQSLPSLVSP